MAAMDQKIRKRIGWLNGEGGFQNTLNYTKVMEAAASTGVDYAELMRIFKDVEEKGMSGVKDATAYVTSAVRKSGGGMMGGGKMAQAYSGMPSMSSETDQKLRKRIGWLNNQGGFDNKLMYDKICEAAVGLSTGDALTVLKNAEEKRDELTDPTSWVTAGMRKSGGGHGGGGGAMMQSMMQAAQYVDYGGNAGAGVVDQKLRKRIGWLNKEGGFENAIMYDKVVAAAAVAGSHDLMRILKGLEEKGVAEVKDPTAYVTAAMRKTAGAAPAMQQWAPAPAWAVGGGVPVADDSKIKKRVGWLNTQGGFENALMYDKVAEAASGVELSEIFRILKDLEEKAGEVKDPTAYVTSAMRKSGRGGGNSGAAQKAFHMAMAGGGAHWAAPMAMDVDSDQKIRKRIGWLNSNKFDNGIKYDAIAEAMVQAGASTGDVLTALKNCEENQGTVKDPTAYVTAAVRRGTRQIQQGPAKVGSKTGAKMPVKKAIMKKK